MTPKVDAIKDRLHTIVKPVPVGLKEDTINSTHSKLQNCSIRVPSYNVRTQHFLCPPLVIGKYSLDNLLRPLFTHLLL